MMEFDASELDALAREFADTEPRVQREMPRIMRKAGVNVRDEWRAHASSSRHFHQIAPTVNFDENLHFGAMYEVEVGLDRRRRAARLGGIYHFGGANGGGGTGGDPQRFADNEAGGLQDAIAAMVDKVLGG